jgi:hypothetical protein
MRKVLFREEQKYDQWWFWLMLMAAFAVSVGPVWYGLIYQVRTGQPWGDEPSSNGELVLIASLVTVLMVGILMLFKTLRLQVEIGEDEIRFRYPPLVRKWRKITREEIEKFEVGRYRPVRAYGGWGIRYGFRKFGRALTVNGTTGLKLFLKNGKIVLLGTQRAQAIAYAMNKMMKRDNTPV